MAELGAYSRFTIYDSLLLSKLITGIEFGHRVQISDAAADCHGEIRLLNHAAEVPVLVVFVGRLVIVSVVVLAEFLLAPPFRPADVIVALLQTDRGHAHLRERKVIRTI